MNDTAMPAPFRAILDPRLFLRAHKATSKEATRYYLMGVNIEPCPAGGVLMVATDGHILLCIRDAEAQANMPAIVMLNQHFIAAVNREIEPRKWIYKIVVTGNRAALVHVTGDKTNDQLFEIAASLGQDVIAFQWKDTIIDGSFPDWRKTVKAPLNIGVKDSFSKWTLDKLTAALGEKNLPSIRLLPISETPAQPHIVLGNGMIDGFGVVMPMRSNAPDKLPGWFDEPPPVPAQADPAPSSPAPEAALVKEDA